MKLRALAPVHLGEPVVGEPEPLPNGVALTHGSSAWVLLEGDAAGSLGAILVWATRRGAASIDIVVDSGGQVLARRATRFSMPISVWTASGRTLWRVEPQPLVPPPDLPDEHRAFTEMIAGATPMRTSVSAKVTDGCTTTGSHAAMRPMIMRRCATRRP